MYNSEEREVSQHLYAPMTLHDIRDGRDWSIKVHKDLVAWLNANVPNAHVRNEIVIAFCGFLKNGWFSIHTERFQFAHGGEAGRQLKFVLDNSPFIVQVKGAMPGVRCRVYQFRLRAICSAKDQSTDNSSRYRLSVRRGYSKVFTICGAWLRRRCQRWAEWCESKGHSLRLDLFGLTRLGKATFDTLTRLSLPTDTSFASDLSDLPSIPGRMSKKLFALWKHAGFLSGKFLRAFMHKDGRSYNPITNCPRTLRQRMRLDGELLREADLGCSYWYLLATQMPAGSERDQLVEAIHSGEFYERVATAAGVTFDDRAKLKCDCQKQLLFFKDWRKSERPLWTGLNSLSPGLCSQIERLRRCYGVSGFAKYLMRLEGLLMDRVHHQLIGRGIHAIRLHDGMLVGESSVELAADAIRSIGVDLFGIEPLVKSK